ncbi:MAG: PRC-barrel domain-containing protein, partial [Alphaproteobacteria bacterium]
MILKNSLLAATCLVTMAGVTMAGMASAASVQPDTAAVIPLQIAAKQASETADMIRASEFIGETVRNGKGEKIGSVDDLILNRADRV